jgi:hypothetical protein
LIDIDKRFAPDSSLNFELNGLNEALAVLGEA